MSLVNDQRCNILTIQVEIWRDRNVLLEDAERAKAENSQLKTLLVERMLDNAMLQDNGCARVDQSISGKLRDECLNETFFST